MTSSSKRLSASKPLLDSSTTSKCVVAQPDTVELAANSATTSSTATPTTDQRDWPELASPARAKTPNHAKSDRADACSAAACQAGPESIVETVSVSSFGSRHIHPSMTLSDFLTLTIKKFINSFEKSSFIYFLLASPVTQVLVLFIKAIQHERKHQNGFYFHFLCQFPNCTSEAKVLQESCETKSVRVVTRN